MGIEFRNAAFSYRKETAVFSNVNLNTVEKDIFCILGPNGCGKTTLLKCASGILKVRSGEVLLDDQSMTALTRDQIARKVGYIPQNHQAGFGYSVFEIVLMGRAPHLNVFASPAKEDAEIARDAIRAIGVEHLATRRYTELSGGEQQLVLIARVLAQQPQILLLDEPTSHLDFKNQTTVLRLLRKLARSGLSVVMTSHFPNHALTFSGCVALMHEGSLFAQGSPEAVMNETNLKKAYGIDVRIYTLTDPIDGSRVSFCAPAHEAEELSGGLEAV